MYVRWKRKPLKRRLRRGEEPDHSLSAVLVESRRVGGQPRQRHVKHLGAIRERCASWPGHAAGFWRTADTALAALGLPVAEQRVIEGQLGDRVPRPTADAARVELAELEVRVARSRYPF